MGSQPSGLERRNHLPRLNLRFGQIGKQDCKVSARRCCGALKHLHIARDGFDLTLDYFSGRLKSFGCAFADARKRVALLTHRGTIGVEPSGHRAKRGAKTLFFATQRFDCI